MAKSKTADTDPTEAAALVADAYAAELDAKHGSDGEQTAQGDIARELAARIRSGAA